MENLGFRTDSGSNGVARRRRRLAACVTLNMERERYRHHDYGSKARLNRTRKGLYCTDSHTVGGGPGPPGPNYLRIGKALPASPHRRTS